MGTENEKAVIPGMPTILPPGIPAEKAEAYICKPFFFIANQISIVVLVLVINIKVEIFVTLY